MREQTIHNEALLAVQFLQGDEGAFDALYNRYYEAVYGNALSILKDPAAAEDIVQEVFLALWQKRNFFEHPDNIGGWLFVTASNKSLNALKKRLRERLTGRPVETLVEIPLIPPGTELEEMQLELLRQAIDALPPGRKKVFELCKFQGKSYEETAAILGISKNTVKKALSRALETMKEYILSHSAGDALLALSLVAMLGF